MDKEKVRMWQWFALAVAVMVGVGFVNGEAWFTYIINSIAKMGIGAFALYRLSRALVHTRTHELAEEYRHARENHLIIAAGIVIGCSLLS